MIRPAFLLALSLLLLSGPAWAGDWRVVPIRIDLGKDKKSDVVRLINQGERSISLQVQGTEWTQDADGNDIYQESADLVFFPKILTIEPKEERVLRAGLRVPAVQAEKTYRLFIEEIPEPHAAEGSAVSINIRFGLPVFIAPLQETWGGSIGDLRLEDGRLTAVIRNDGNSHFRINKLVVTGKGPKGESLFTREIQGWYLLAGSSRSYALPLDGEAYGQAAALDLDVDTDKQDLHGSLALTPATGRP